MIETNVSRTPEHLRQGGENMIQLTDALDWSTTPLGPAEHWPASLRSIARMMLSAQQPMFVAWGPELTFLYNDAYAPILGGKHPRALGRSFAEVWSDIWEQFEPIVARTLAGEPSWYEDLPILMERHGYQEETWFSFSYTAVTDDTGNTAGLFCACTETTAKVLGERRLRKSQARAQGVLEGMAEGFVLLDHEFRVLDINAEGLRLETRPRDAILGSIHWEAWPGTETSEVGRLYKKAMAERTSAGLEHRHLWPDGRETWIDMRAYPHPDGLAIFYRDITSRVQAEERLRETSRRLDAVLSNTTMAVLLMNDRQHCIYANAAAEKLTGYSFDELQSRPLHDVIHNKKPDGSHYPLHECPIDRAFPERAQVQGEELFVAPDGSFYPVAFTASPVLNDEGKPIGTVIEARNIAAEKARDATLRETEERYRLAAHATNDAIWDWDFAADQILWNEALTALFGHTPAGLLTSGGWWKETIHPDDRERVVAGIYAVIEGGEEQWSDEYRFMTAKGQEVHVYDRGTVIRDASGRAVRMIGAMLDLTERRRAEDALRGLNENLEGLVAERTAERDRTWRLSKELLGVADAEGKWVSINPAWQATLGWSEAEILGRTSEWLEHPDDTEATREEVAKLAAGRDTLRFENRFRHIDGSYRWLSWTAVPESGLLYAVARDVTAEKEQADALRQAEEALRQAQKMEAVGQLTGGIAHDFNNLLAGITGSLEIIDRRLSQGRTEDVGRFIDGALTSAQRAAALTQRLLAFSRRQTLDPKPTDVNRLVFGMEDLIRRTVGPAIKVEVVGAGGLWPTEVDAAQLESALLNLAINARDAMPQGGQLTIETANKWLDKRAGHERDLPPGQYISICVTDSGTGIPKELVDRIFDPFFTTKPIGQGTGLGLSMIHGFVRQSGGQVRVYSEPGHGTTMCLYLPRYSGELAADEDGPVAAIAEVGAGETVLVIDDEPTVRMLIVEVLEEAGYTALEAEDGPSGLKILQSGARIDLLITDVGLPGGMNGRQVADAARSARPDLKVLFVTGFAENAAVGNGHLESGMEVITKPFVMTELANKITDMIES